MGFLVFALGSAVGSFMNVVIDRVPAGKSIVRPGSHCPACNTPLKLLDLVPVASYIWLRGKCRYCSSPIPVRLLLVELTMGVFLLGTYLWVGFNVGWLAVVGIAGVLIAIGLSAVARRG